MASLMKLVATRAPLGLVTPRLMRGLCGCSHRLGAAAEARETKGAFTSNLPGSSDVETQPGTSMRALVKRHREKGLWLEDVEIPKMGPMDVLIQIKSASLCGTDVHIYNWDDWAAQTVPAPMRIGHEWGGVIVEKGSAVKSLQVGQRVTGEGHIACGTCRNCRAGTQHLCRDVLGVGVTHPGAFCDFFSLPATNVFPLPDEIDFKYASIMDPLGNAVHCALAFDLVGEDVLITGAGPIGAMAAAVCKFVGARHVVVTDINDYRLDLAKQCGADVVVNVSDNSEERLQTAMSELGMSEGFDIALEMSGVEDGYTQLLSSMNHGGRVAILGIPSRPIAIDWNMVVFKGLSLKGIYGREMYETWYKMSNMLVAGLDKQIAPVITHQLDFEDFQEAFDIMLSGQSGKVVLNLND